ncbi:MAG: hypothetical protein PW999_07940 [Paraburkholderia tropica]|uniref:Uncharacterized protein n=1 Tax=Paraburkholderia tropica TaxID=92647 RepID=A0ABX5MN10_9BURK|nr:hypothetical protein [Paraburkholderia tropica]MDE1139575.1 hypothetical protein [Paraburkholderia tropica]PXX14500.1 hypothetical protein C7400_112111 [Paraburkholderia tropica]PZW79565.1 hypothetical protein C7399_112110 [Paraburkholderia tropica]
MNLKAIFQKVFPWIKSEAKSVETRIDVGAHLTEQDVKELADSIRAAVDARLSGLGAAVSAEMDARLTADTALAAQINPVIAASSVSVLDQATGAGWTISKDGIFSITNSTTEADMSNINVAIQIALALKANDPSLTDAAVQAAANAALAAAYPAAAPAA